MKLREIKTIDLTEKKHPVHKAMKHPAGTKVKHAVTGATGVINGPYFSGIGYGWYPVLTHVNGHECNSSWHDHQTVPVVTPTTNGGGAPAAVDVPPPMSTDSAGAPVQDAGGGAYAGSADAGSPPAASGGVAEAQAVQETYTTPAPAPKVVTQYTKIASGFGWTAAGSSLKHKKHGVIRPDGMGGWMYEPKGADGKAVKGKTPEDMEQHLKMLDSKE
jgi:hypothetical protein